MAQQITPEVETFLRRAIPHYLAGKSFEDSLRAVLADDERLFAAFHDRNRSYFMPTCDERGYSYHTGERKGDLIAAEMARTVYTTIRAEQVPA